jgi:bifunctional non-homologous end joining protein LigD
MKQIWKESLAEYDKKRHFRHTPEPVAKITSRKERADSLRFVVQKHDATWLHYDFRLETKKGVLKSWAVPKGPSLDPSIKRLAIMTEDHPLDYIDFEGEIPEGNYGAGSVIVWDTGKYTSDHDVEQQVNAGKISFTLFGEKLKGSFSLVKTEKAENQWLMIKSRDGHASPEELTELMPDPSASQSNPKKQIGRRRVTASNTSGTPREFALTVSPMLAMPVDEPFDRDDWVFEVKWDGVRALYFRNKSDNILQLRSRKGNDISHRYPELTRIADSVVQCNNSVVLDGEIVVLNKDGIPDFQTHQKRMNVESEKEIEFMARQYPTTYYVFDILYLDGLSLEGLDFITRRNILSKVIGRPTEQIRISEFMEGDGRRIFENAISMKLEGIVAKYRYSIYSQGTRSPAWLKLKGVLTQDCVVIGYTKGEGNREGYFGSLILAVNDKGKLRFVGHSGSGFGFDQLEDTLRMMQPLTVNKCPIDHVPYVNREPVWLKPELIVEVKFQGWTEERIMRAPIFVRFREDKRPMDCILETPKSTELLVEQTVSTMEKGRSSSAAYPFSNLEKVFWNASSTHKALTKKDLIEYYDKISNHLLPQLADRPLSLSRYPNGVLGKSFYHKNWDQPMPEYARSIQVYSETSERIINYLLCNNRETLLWLANLGCIEMHPWYSRVRDFSTCAKIARLKAGDAAPPLDETKCGLEIPEFVVFDIDPYIYSGSERRGQEPEYNVKGFKAAVYVAFELRDLLDSYRIRSYVKTSGKTGLLVFVPIAPTFTYDQTKAFAEAVSKILVRKYSGKVTTEWSTSKRKGKVFLDYNQNVRGKTIASVLSVRPTISATVSMPIGWDRLGDILPTDFTMLNVPEILEVEGNPWNEMLQKKQDLLSLIESAQ